MPLFHYKALASRGQTLEGQMDAPDADAVIARLQESGYYPIHAEPVAARRVGASHWLARGIGRGQLQMMTRKLAVTMKAGLTLEEALALLIETADAGPMKQMLEQVAVTVQNGAALSDALERHSSVFDRFYINTLRAGEAAGALDVVLARLADYLEHSQALRRNLQSALIYPAILVVVAVATLMVLLLYVVPQFQLLFEDMGQLLPLSTRIVIAIADALKDYGWMLALLLLVGVALGRQVLRDDQARAPLDRLLLRLPLISDLVVGNEVARFSRGLATLIANGVPMLSALSVVEESINNSVIRRGIAKVRAQVGEGQGISLPLGRERIFPVMAVQLIRVGEETGELEAMLEQVADIYDQELDEAIRRFLTLLEPALIIILGVVIAAIIISVLVAILSLNDFVV